MNTKMLRMMCALLAMAVLCGLLLIGCDGPAAGTEGETDDATEISTDPTETDPKETQAPETTKPAETDAPIVIPTPPTSSDLEVGKDTGDEFGELLD